MTTITISNPILAFVFCVALFNGLVVMLVDVLKILCLCAEAADRYFKYRTEDAIREAVWEYELPRQAEKIKAGAR